MTETLKEKEKEKGKLLDEGECEMRERGTAREKQMERNRKK